MLLSFWLDVMNMSLSSKTKTKKKEKQILKDEKFDVFVYRCRAVTLSWSTSTLVSVMVRRQRDCWSDTMCTYSITWRNDFNNFTRIWIDFTFVNIFNDGSCPSKERRERSERIFLRIFSNNKIEKCSQLCLREKEIFGKCCQRSDEKLFRIFLKIPW